MVFDVSVALTWILFVALFPITFFWIRRAWRITFRHDLSEVALKRGLPPPNPEKYARYAAAIHWCAGAITLVTIFFILFGAWPYELWSGVAGSTIWMKFIFDFILSRQAHMASTVKAPGAVR